MVAPRNIRPWDCGKDRHGDKAKQTTDAEREREKKKIHQLILPINSRFIYTKLNNSIIILYAILYCAPWEGKIKSEILSFNSDFCGRNSIRPPLSSSFPNPLQISHGSRRLHPHSIRLYHPLIPPSSSRLYPAPTHLLPRLTPLPLLLTLTLLPGRSNRVKGAAFPPTRCVPAFTAL